VRARRLIAGVALGVVALACAAWWLRATPSPAAAPRDASAPEATGSVSAARATGGSGGAAASAAAPRPSDDRFRRRLMQSARGSGGGARAGDPRAIIPNAPPSTRNVSRDRF
jgi:hypothetical protein